MDKGSSNRQKVVSTCCAVAGGLGAVACAVSMTLAALGALGTAAAASAAIGMQSMGNQPGGSAPGPSGLSAFINFLVRAGPPILLVSVALLAFSLGMRRRLAALVAVAIGASMYWGMYGQSRLSLMYLSIGIALIAWAVVYLWTFRPAALGRR